MPSQPQLGARAAGPQLHTCPHLTPPIGVGHARDCSSFAVDRFELVRVLDIDDRKLEQADTLYRQPSLFGPQWVAASNPADSDERNDLILESVFGGADLAQRPNLYQPLSAQKDAIAQRTSAI